MIKTSLRLFWSYCTLLAPLVVASGAILLSMLALKNGQHYGHTASLLLAFLSVGGCSLTLVIGIRRRPKDSREVGKPEQKHSSRSFVGVFALLMLFGVMIYVVASGMELSGTTLIGLGVFAIAGYFISLGSQQTRVSE